MVDTAVDTLSDPGPTTAVITATLDLGDAGPGVHEAVQLFGVDIDQQGGGLAVMNCSAAGSMVADDTPGACASQLAAPMASLMPSTLSRGVCPSTGPVEKHSLAPSQGGL